MTQDEIIELAREANASFETAESMFKFAKLVAAKEREALVLFLRNLADDHTPSDCADMICALQSLGAIRARSISRGAA